MEKVLEGAALAAITLGMMAGTVVPAEAQQIYAQILPQQVLADQKQQEALDRKNQEELAKLQQQQRIMQMIQQLQQQLQHNREQLLQEREKQQIEAIKQLAAAGIFKQDNNSPAAPGEALTREQLATVLARLLGQESQAGAPVGNVSFSDVTTSDWYAGYIQVAKTGGLIDSTASGQMTREQLAALFLQGLNGAAGGTGKLQDPSRSVEQFIQALAGTDPLVLQKTPANEKKLHDDLLEQIASQGGDDDQWADYPFYAAGENTAVLPDGSEDFLDSYGAATYNGIIVGEAANGTALTGTSSFDFYFAPGDTSIHGAFEFDQGDHLDLSGYADEHDVVLWIDDGATFQGDMVNTDTARLGADFYGPNAEEFAGTWAFESAVDTSNAASGQFATKR